MRGAPALPTQGNVVMTGFLDGHVKPLNAGIGAKSIFSARGARRRATDGTGPVAWPPSPCKLLLSTTYHGRVRPCYFRRGFLAGGSPQENEWIPYLAKCLPTISQEFVKWLYGITIPSKRHLATPLTKITVPTPRNHYCGGQDGGPYGVGTAHATLQSRRLRLGSAGWITAGGCFGCNAKCVSLVNFATTAVRTSIRER